MKINIEVSPKELVDLATELQSRPFPNLQSLIDDAIQHQMEFDILLPEDD